MLQYTYEIQRPVANTPGKRRNLFGYEATLQQATEVQPEQTWPDKEHVILVQQLLLDTRAELDAEMHAWVDSASAGQKLEICFRSIRVVWKSGRAFVQAPDGHVQAALDAILDYALLARAIANAEEQARTLGDQMLQLMQHNESRLQIPSLRKYLNEATQLASTWWISDPTASFLHALERSPSVPACVPSCSRKPKPVTGWICLNTGWRLCWTGWRHNCREPRNPGAAHWKPGLD